MRILTWQSANKIEFNIVYITFGHFLYIFASQLALKFNQPDFNDQNGKVLLQPISVDSPNIWEVFMSCIVCADYNNSSTWSSLKIEDFHYYRLPFGVMSPKIRVEYIKWSCFPENPAYPHHVYMRRFQGRHFHQGETSSFTFHICGESKFFWWKILCFSTQGPPKWMVYNGKPY